MKLPPQTPHLRKIIPTLEECIVIIDDPLVLNNPWHYHPEIELLYSKARDLAQEITGDFVRKLTYPDTALGINKDNVQEAISRQAGNELDNRVWWDKP